MASKNPVQRLADILDNIEAIRSFISGLSFESFRQDRRTAYAVVRALEIISEASRRLPEEIKSRHADLDWAAIAAAGNIYRQEYESVDDRLIWDTVAGGLEDLRMAVAGELKQIRGGRS
jgi:uncharacterized protein with HEPN domain